MTNDAIEVETFISEGWAQNAYLVRPTHGNGLVAIDPGGAAPDMRKAIGNDALDAIVLTHAHLDHVAGVAELVEATGAPIYLHPSDRILYDRTPQQAAMFGVEIRTPPPPDHEITAPSTLEFKDLRFEVRFVPGHSPGHVLLYSEAGGIAFVGDVVFMGSIGRTDLPGGDYSTLMKSIRDHVLTLPDETRLYSGHGPVTTVGHERIANPFLAPIFGGGGFA